MASTLLPTPTFSPTEVQLPGAPPRPGLWLILPAAAILAVHDWAKPASDPLDERAGRPLDARRLLIFATKSPELAEAEVGSVKEMNPKMRVAAVSARMRYFKVPPCSDPRRHKAPFGSSAAFRKFLVRPVALRPLISQGLPFRGCVLRSPVSSA